MVNALWRQWNIPPWLIVPMEKAWFHVRFFFEAAIVMIKDTRKCDKKMQCQKKKLFYTLYEVGKSNVITSFRGI